MSLAISTTALLIALVSPSMELGSNLRKECLWWQTSLLVLAWLMLMVMMIIDGSVMRVDNHNDVGDSAPAISWVTGTATGGWVAFNLESVPAHPACDPFTPVTHFRTTLPPLLDFYSGPAGWISIFSLITRVAFTALYRT